MTNRFRMHMKLIAFLGVVVLLGYLLSPYANTINDWNIQASEKVQATADSSIDLTQWNDLHPKVVKAKIHNYGSIEGFIRTGKLLWYSIIKHMLLIIGFIGIPAWLFQKIRSKLKSIKASSTTNP